MCASAHPTSKWLPMTESTDGRTHRRTTSATLVAGVLAGSLLASALLPVASAQARDVRGTSNATSRAAAAGPDRAEATYRAVSLPGLGAAKRGSGPAGTSTLTLARTSSFGLVGVTWARGTGGDDVRVEIRTRGSAGWTAWSSLEVDTEGDAAPGHRAGTEPLWVGTSTGVQARVSAPGSGSDPRDLRLALVAPGSAPTPTLPGAPVTAARGSSSLGQPRYTKQPGIITRAKWGARRNTSCDQPHFGRTQLGVVVHHTAGSNSYSRGQSAGIVRSIQSYHMSGRGWCDIGYNFLVDKYGQVFEGRNGKVAYQVRGAHAGNYGVNTYATGVSMMANLDTASPTSAMKRAMVRVVGWRIGTWYLAPNASYSLDGHSLPVISGHRDVHNRGFSPSTATACPGRYGYAWLNAKGGLRAQVASYVARYRTSIELKQQALGGSTTGQVYAGEAPYGPGYRTRFTNGDIYWISRAATGARWVAGPFRTELSAIGGATGRLGFPSGEPTVVSAGRYSQDFQYGTMYRVGSTAYALAARIDDAYRAHRGFAGDLGDPTSRTVTRESGYLDVATFQHGWISFDRHDRSTTVKVK